MVESAVLHGFRRLQYAVSIPFGDGHPYDLVVDLGAAMFLRVQCKSARVRDGCLMFNSCSTDHGSGRRSYLGLADAFGVVGPDPDAVYLLPVAECAGFVTTLRLEPARNNQRARIRLAHRYELKNWKRSSLVGLIHGDPPISNIESAA